MELDMSEVTKGKPKASPGDDAAGDILAAIKAGDASALNLALTRHYEACASGGYEDEDEEA